MDGLDCGLAGLMGVGVEGAEIAINGFVRDGIAQYLDKWLVEMGGG